MRVRAMKSGGGAKARGVEQALDHIWPDKIPEGLSAKERNSTVREWLIAKRLSVPNDIAKAIQRALNARQLRKDKTVPAPASSRGACFAAADAKIFAEALSRRDESLANVKRRQDAAMAKK
jgi:hypothetical protein